MLSCAEVNFVRQWMLAEEFAEGRRISIRPCSGRIRGKDQLVLYDNSDLDLCSAADLRGSLSKESIADLQLHVATAYWIDATEQNHYLEHHGFETPRFADSDIRKALRRNRLDGIIHDQAHLSIVLRCNRRALFEDKKLNCGRTFDRSSFRVQIRHLRVDTRFNGCVGRVLGLSSAGTNAGRIAVLMEGGVVRLVRPANLFLHAG